MSRRNWAVLILVLGLLVAVPIVIVGWTIWTLPAAILPEPLYRWKYGPYPYPVTRTAGDATLHDAGFRVGFGRYTVDLGPVADDPHVEHVFTIRDLPDERLTIGLDVTRLGGGPDIKFQKPEIGKVDLVVTDEDGVVVCGGQGPLIDWVWSGLLSRDDNAFVYPWTNYVIEPGVYEADGRLPYAFRPAPDGVYQVRLIGDWQPGVPDTYKIRLLFEGGGYLTSSTKE